MVLNKQVNENDFDKVMHNYHPFEDSSTTIQNNEQMLHQQENQIQIHHQLMEHIQFLHNYYLFIVNKLK